MKDEVIHVGEGGQKRHEGDARMKPVAVVCTLSSNVCKMAAVALGWDAAFEVGKWVNIDGGLDFDWRPTEVP